MGHRLFPIIEGAYLEPEEVVVAAVVLAAVVSSATSQNPLASVASRR